MNEKIKVSNIVIITLILITLIASALGIVAYARYRSSFTGTASKQVAKWDFKVVDGIPQTSDVIDFAITRTDTNTTVAEEKIAPRNKWKA